MTLVRLQKYLSECGVASRRHSEELIEEGRVKVNGKIITELGTKVDPARDRITVGKKVVTVAPKGAAIFHKPRAVISTLSDPEGRPCVADYLAKQYSSYYPVGRLDWESSGLIVLTNDGELAEALTHPRFEISRTYQARVERSVSERTLEKIRRGINLKDGFVRAKVEIIRNDNEDNSTWLEVTITEGRNRLIRRMMEKVEHPVMKLKRVAHGPFKLGKLKPGEVRPLIQKDYLQLRQRVLTRSRNKS
jgi:23S rRNA pseudouridine2605 synthase